jgi:hypothetical protein
VLRRLVDDNNLGSKVTISSDPISTRIRQEVKESSMPGLHFGIGRSRLALVRGEFTQRRDTENNTQ